MSGHEVTVDRDSERELGVTWVTGLLFGMLTWELAMRLDNHLFRLQTGSQLGAHGALHLER